MDNRTIRICFSFLLFSFVIEANTNAKETITEDDLRQPRVSGRIVKVYSGTRPEPVYCQQEGFQADPADCAVFYRCVKGASNKFTVFRFQCGPGTVYDPDTEVCNFPLSTKRSECGGVVIPSTEKSNENEIEGAQSEIPSPISISKPIYGESIRETTTHSTAYPWASSNTQNTQKSSSASTAYPWMTTNANKGSPSNKPISPVQPSRQEGDACTTDGFMGDSENCRKFYRCVGNQRGSFIRYEFMCSESTIWDDDAQSCNHPWAVQRRRCGRGNSDGDRQPSTSNQQDNQVPPNTTIQEQLQINYGDKVTQTQTQISHGQVIQNQTQINYGNQPNKAQNSQVRQNQTQISQGSAVSQTQTQINHGDNAVQTQLQIDHTKDSSQSQTQVHETTSRTTTITSNAAPEEQDQGYGNHQNDPEDSEETDSSSNQCTESGFMGDSMNCKKFYRCVDNGKGGFTKYEFTCGEGTVWDSSIEACNHEWAVKKCGGKVPQSSPEDGPQSTTTTRTTTTTAKTTQNYQPTSESTTDEDYDTGYGNQNQQSETSTSSTATSITTLQTSSAISTSGPPSNSTECQSSGFMGDANDCSKFYRCVDNGKGGFTKYEFKCGDGTVWDPEIDACNHPWAVKKCGGSSTDVNKVETTTGVGTTQAITSVSLVQTTTQASSENVDYDSGYGQQQSESSSSSTSTTKQPQAGGSNDDNKCQSSGFMGDENDCSKFYRCVDNGNGAYTRYEFKCGEGTVWDPKIEACNHPWAVEKCGGSNSGDINKETTPVPSQTMSDEQTGTTGVPEKEIDKPTQSPAISVQTTEQPKPTKPPIGNECSQEGFMGDKSDCKKFYRCVNDGRGGFIKYEFSCGDGTVWDSEQNTCNHENSVKNPCSSSTSSQNENVSESSQESTTQAVQTTSAQSTEESNTTEKTSTTTKPSSGKECQQEGFVGDEYDCKKFYRCVDNGRGGYIRYEFSCGEGTVWDPELNTCNHPSGDNRCGGTGNQPSSTQPDRENDEPITDATSSTTQSSTEQSQATTAAQKPIPSSDTCTSEGFFGDSKDCKKFYRCVDNGKGGYTKYDFNCGDGTIWDDEIQACNHETGTSNCTKNSSNETQTSRPQTESTDDGSSTTSSSTEGQESTQKTEAPPAESSGNCTSEGFYANQNDCRKFYRCVSNDKGGYTRYDFSCGEGTMWVQEIQACDHDTGEMSCGSQNAPVSSTTESTTSTSHQSSSSTTLSSTATQKPVKEDDEYSSDTSSQPPSSSSDDKCTSEGFYPNKNDCRQFYRCVDNGNGEYTKYDFTCGEGTAWDSEVETCNHISEVKNCQGDSQSQPMQDEETSQSPGSSTTESTTNSSTSGSTTENTKPSQDTCKQEGYFGNTQDCTKFYRCVDNGNGGLTKYDFSCGEGTIWDQDVLTCNHPQDVNNPSCQQSENNQSSDSSSSSTSSSSPTSSSSSTTSSSSSSSSTTESSGSADCSQGSTKKPANSNVNCTKAGYYPDPDDCKKFYRCVDWDGDGKRFSVYHFDCGEGTIWDPALDTCNHEDSVYPPRDCSGGSQSQNENVDQESTTTTTEGTTTEEDSKTTEQTTQESTASEQTTQQSSNEQTTTEQNTTSEQTTEQSTTQQGSEEHSTTEQTTNEQTTTQQSTTEQTNEQESTTKESTTEHSDNQESTTKESSNTEESTTQESTDQSTTEQSTTEQSTTEQSTTEQSITEQSTTEQSTTEHSTTKQSTTEQSTTEQSTTEQTTTTQSTTEQSTTEQSTTEQTDDGETTESEKDSTTESETESSTENGEVTTESSSSSDKDCPETEDDQNLFVCPTSFRRHPKYCNMFYQCTEDDDTHDVQIATFRCPNNTIYDESKTKCVEEKKADKKCDGEIAQKRRVKRLDSTHKEPIIVTNERLKCPAAGHYPFEKEECSPAFLKCQKTKSGKLRGYVYQCPPNHVYWSVSRRCEPKGHLRDCKRSYNNWNGRWEIPVERRNVAP
ncbi:serine-rich adhesin for platelets-like [Pectinophora gossypiella]|uniref:serine-rich adhesin for platelets-like n=1 Tax=Pectinophora gossypiella TaxID=13191 RepID=UPI00214EE905|nr:serine-rich adhesin for platelets-like [Pectinophora gossypiella]